MTTPTPEASEAAARALLAITPAEHLPYVAVPCWSDLHEADKVYYRRLATEALSAAAPFIAAQAKAEALAEVEAKHSDELDEVMRERDECEEWADRLAYAIAPVEVIGEHSSGNNPWENALDYLR